MKLIILLLKKIILRYEINHPNYEEPIYICTHIDTRNNAKNDKYKIPSDQPQCPVYKDNRCCGGCKYTSICDHCVDCHCYGHVYAAMGGNDKSYLLKKSSKYSIGRLDQNGKFDWEYYYYKSKKYLLKKGVYFICNGFAYQVIKVDTKDNVKMYNLDKNIYEKMSINDLPNCITTYQSFDAMKCTYGYLWRTEFIEK